MVNFIKLALFFISTSILLKACKARVEVNSTAPADSVLVTKGPILLYVHPVVTYIDSTVDTLKQAYYIYYPTNIHLQHGDELGGRLVWRDVKRREYIIIATNVRSFYLIGTLQSK